jgi:2-amino-4-hydroxy-6-hydroxymethyldihydropteridine diphosphokinase
MSRVRIFKWGPRNIDLDIIFYENMVIDEKYLRIPHPDAHNRAFVLEPLSEISPGYIHPILKKTVRELLSELHKREINHKK